MKNIFITRQIPETAIKKLEEKGHSVTVGKYKTPITEKQKTKEIYEQNGIKTQIARTTRALNKTINNSKKPTKQENYTILHTVCGSSVLAWCGLSLEPSLLVFENASINEPEL